MIFGREPTLIAAAVAIAINLAVSFGLKLDAVQISGLNALLIAVMAVVVRSVVTPMAAPALPLGTPVIVLGSNKDEPPPDAVVALKAA